MMRPRVGLPRCGLRSQMQRFVFACSVIHEGGFGSLSDSHDSYGKNNKHECDNATHQWKHSRRFHGNIYGDGDSQASQGYEVHF